MRRAILAIVFSILIASPAFADGLDSQHKAWNVFSITQQGEQICYITSSPIKEAGNWNNRSDPYVLVTYRNTGVSEISVSSGYPYKEGSKVDVSVDKATNYRFFTSNDTPNIAWARDVAEDKRVVKNMIRGSRLTVKGVSPKDTWSTDTYSLYGFTKAYKRMQELCDSLRAAAAIPVIAPVQATSSPAEEKKEADSNKPAAQ